MIIEFFGLPGSGKTFLLKKFFSNKNIKKRFYSSYSEFFFKQYLHEENLSYYKKLKFNLYYKYYKKNFLKSNIIFSKEFQKILKILKSYKLDKYNKFIFYFKEILSKTDYSKIRKKRIYYNFLIDLIAYDFFVKKKLYKNSFIINDEGFYQRCFMNYNNFNKIIINKNIDKYIQRIPSVDMAVFINESDETCFNRVKNRKYGFNYHSKSIDIIKKYRMINLKIFSNLKKRKTNTLKINSNKFFKKSVIKLYNVILKK